MHPKIGIKICILKKVLIKEIQPLFTEKQFNGRMYQSFQHVQNQSPRVFYKKGFFKNFGKFTGKHPRRSLFVI